MRHLAVVLLLAAGLLPATQGQAFEYFGTNATWAAFKGRAEASAPIEAWRQRAFDDAAWERGPAPFFYGEPLAGGTVLNDMPNSYSTVFLRRTFVVTNAAAVASLELEVVCDDGFIAWVNGVEVARSGAPADGPWFNSLAGSNAPEPVAFTAFPVAAAENLLVTGTNVLAIQMFNTSLGSSDLVFAAALAAALKPRPEPVVVARSPFPGEVTSLTRVTVTFSQPVSGVEAGDLLVNDLPCTGLTGSGDTYTFSFDQPAFGPVQFSWVMRCEISDQSTPPVAFNPTGDGARWRYELRDVSAPRLVSVLPPAGGTLRRLAQAEVVFDRAMLGVDAADLLVNGRPATNVTGVAAGPYVFSFPEVAAGPVEFRWADDHGIHDAQAEGGRFAGGSWPLQVDPQLPLADVVIDEFMAENVTGLRDEEGDAEDWIELWNRGASAVNLAGWSLTDEAARPGQWTFPAVTVPAGGRLVVFASGKDRPGTSGGLRPHTNFKLAVDGEYLGLFAPELPRRVVDELAPRYPAQRADYAYGREPAGQWRYYATPSAGAPNGPSLIDRAVDEVHFSVARGFFARPFALSLATVTPGASIRFTTNGSLPTATTGFVYDTPIPITGTRIIRAAAFATNQLPSQVRTHTYLYNLPANRRFLPALSLVTATNHLFGQSGIMEVNPRNTTKHGLAWERPVSAEWIQPGDNGGFQIDCGIRVQGGGYIRELYDYRSATVPNNKYSFRLYFRGDYGAGRLEWPLFPGTSVASFDTVSLRAGMNDPTNPFLRDELVRQLESDVGQVAAHGTFVNLFLNGVYKGYYNPAERIDTDFLRTYHGGTNDWDLIAQYTEVRDGDLTSWTELKNFANRNDLAVPANYEALERRLDTTNLVEYLLPLIYADTDDWPHNNWRAARERTPAGRWRFYCWDAEWSFNGSVSHNTITGQLSSTSPPWGTVEIQQLFNRLKGAPEFKLLFADRVHHHFFNDGAMTDTRLKARYEQLKGVLAGTIPSFDNSIGTSWIPNRRRMLTNHFQAAGFLASSNAPVFAKRGGVVPAGFPVAMTAGTGTIYYTTNGADPRERFSARVAPVATVYDPVQPPVLAASALVRARTLWSTNWNTSTNWSAVTEAAFQVEEPVLPLRITEINYHPPGGDAYEFIELANLSLLPVDLGGVSLEGVTFRFPAGVTLAGGARVVLAADASPAAFAARYPGVSVAGYFSGALANSGERLAILDRAGRTVTAVTFSDGAGWPAEADGKGATLELIPGALNPNDPAGWRASLNPGGSPGRANAPSTLPVLRLNEVSAAAPSPPVAGGRTNDWFELYNAGSASVDLAGWSVGDGGAPRRFVFPRLLLDPGTYLVVACHPNAPAGELATGFALDAEGESLFLSDPGGRRQDAVSWGAQIAGFTIGRVGAKNAWQLTEPTPGSANEPAALAATTNLVVNEFLADALPGGDDWVELFNRDAQLPLALGGLALGTSNAVAEMPNLAFVPPRGFVVLRADGRAEVGHLDLKLSSPQGLLTLLGGQEGEWQRVNYARAIEGTSQGFLPDGSGNLVSFPGSASPGASNYLADYQGVVINEVLARSVTNPADWIELFNPTPATISLAGMSLGLDAARPGGWVFPAGVSLPAGAYLVITCDATRPASTNAGGSLNCGRALAAEGGGVHLFNAAGQRLQFIEYGAQLPDRSIGRSDAGWVLLASPTPGRANTVRAPLGDVFNVRLNEWMAGGTAGDWLELFNRDASPVDLGECVLTDDPSIAGETKSPVQPLTFIAGGGWLEWRADGAPAPDPGHLPFRLDAMGETLRLYAPDRRVIDSVDYLAQTTGGSSGRFPDGATNFLAFADTASPGAPNWLPVADVVINEVLTHTDPPLEDAIELFNCGATTVALGGWWLSDDPRQPRKFVVPAGTSLAPGGFAVFYQKQFEPVPGAPTSFKLDPDRGGQVVLSEVDAQGEPTGYRAGLAFGAAENGVSFGRHPTSRGDDFAFLERRTFGSDTPTTLEQFRAGRGAVNARPLIGPVVISEIMYRPAATGPGSTEDARFEFIELHNRSAQPVALAMATTNGSVAWQLSGGIRHRFGDQMLGPGDFLLVVGFDPVSDPTARAAFLQQYRVPAGVGIVGPFEGRLGNDGEAIVLSRPAEPVLLAGGGQFVPQIQVDRVEYGTRLPWPSGAAGMGMSLQRREMAGYGNEPTNWRAAWPTPGAASATSAGDADQDGLPDDWELDHGLSPTSALGINGALGDFDGDGLPNLDEYLAGTNPAALTVRITRIALEPGFLRIGFNAKAGVEYRIEYTEALESGVWKPLAGFGPWATTGLVERRYPFSTPGAARYFRIVVVGS